MIKQKTAAAAIIGNEILTGKIKDDNTFVLSTLLFYQGINLCKVEIIPDNVSEISNVVYRLSKTFDYVFTSGGIGPTHDDKTYKSIAKAFKLKLKYDNSIIKKIAIFYKKNITDITLNKVQQKMLIFPYPCKIFFSKSLFLPLITVKNVYILPGEPKLFQDILYDIKHNFNGPKKRRELIYTQKSENEIAILLEQFQLKYPDISIGSYPKIQSDKYKVMISLESLNVKQILEATINIKTAINGFTNL